ncbi:MAG: hypothetical protein IMZ53_11415 [Thermoplasmata archaeon]|nr:hypothetical protein [Thermoplasmata archaeon]
MLCKNCRKDFEPKRTTQAYCSRECQLRKACATIAQQPIAQETAQRLPANYGLPDCTCWHCKQNRSQPEARQYIINHSPYKTASEFVGREINRVSLPGDCDYQGVCHKESGQWMV